MFLACLYPICRYRPNSVREIDLFPTCANGLARARSRKNEKPEGKRGNGFLRPQGRHKDPYLVVGKRRVVLYPTYLAAIRQEVFKMPDASGLGFRPADNPVQQPNRARILFAP